MEIKEAVLCWLRFARQFGYVATEFGSYSADVFAACEDKTYEIEVKVSLQDLRADFLKGKHEVYQRYEEQYPYDKICVPNLFSFVVPEDLVERATEIIPEKNPLYGIISYSNDRTFAKDRLRVVKRAGRIHKNKPTRELFDSMAKRMSSDLCANYLMRNRIEEIHAMVRNDMRLLNEKGQDVLALEEIKNEGIRCEGEASPHGETQGQCETAQKVFTEQKAPSNEGRPMNGTGRFDYVKYDDKAVTLQESFKQKFSELEQSVCCLKDGREKSLAMTKIEEAYMWIGKALRAEQLARNGSAELQK